MWLDGLAEVLSFTVAVFFLVTGGYALGKGYTEGGICIIAGCIFILILLEVVKRGEQQ